MGDGIATEAVATVHIPTVATRHPLWDDYDEEADPDDRRLLDEARLTLTTSLAGRASAFCRSMPQDTILPPAGIAGYVRHLSAAGFSEGLDLTGGVYRLRGAYGSVDVAKAA